MELEFQLIIIQDTNIKENGEMIFLMAMVNKAGIVVNIMKETSMKE